MPEKESPLILVVDDTQQNLDVLVEILAPSYRLKVAKSGPRALALCDQERPSLILLDIMMPEMSGFDLCQIVKKRSDMACVPIIFISAAGDTNSKVRAFELGGVDYVSKPFQAKELLARIHTHLALRNLQLELQRHNDDLDALVEEKNCELVKAYERLALADKSKSEFLELLAHEIRTPANGIIGLSELLMNFVEPCQEVTELKEMFTHSKERMLETINTALLLARIDIASEAFAMTPLDPIPFLKKLFPTNLLESSCQMPLVAADNDLFLKAFRILFDLVSLFSSQEDVEISLSQDDSFFRANFSGKGKGIGEEYCFSFFDVYRSSRSMTYAAPLGLAPALAQKIFAFYDGQLSIKNSAESVGVIVELKLPLLR